MNKIITDATSDNISSTENANANARKPTNPKKINIDPSIVLKLIDNLNNSNNIWKDTSDTSDTSNHCENSTLESITEPNTPKTPLGDDKTGYYYRHREQKIEYQKKYNREQGDKIKNYNKDYYQKRREEILEKAKTKIICECGCEVQLFNMNSHKKTKKHAKALANVHALERAIDAV